MKVRDSINICFPQNIDPYDSYGLLGSQLARYLSRQGVYVNLFAQNMKLYFRLLKFVVPHIWVLALARNISCPQGLRAKPRVDCSTLRPGHRSKLRTCRKISADSEERRGLIDARS